MLCLIIADGHQFTIDENDETNINTHFKIYDNLLLIT